MARTKKMAVVAKGCVACGCCVKACPLGAITIYKGVYAEVDTGKCVGCGRCAAACPAAVITIEQRGDQLEEKAVV